MANPICGDKEFIQLFNEYGPAATANALQVNVRSVHSRRRALEKRKGITLVSPVDPGDPKMAPKFIAPEAAPRIPINIQDGVVLVGSDSHYWPGIVSTAHKAFVKLNKELKPRLVIKNGDELDFPSISRFMPIGWENRPKVQEEIENTQDMLHEITEANKNAQYLWPLGNHDARFETRLAHAAPEFARVQGVHLKDHFPRWKPCWSVWINEDVVVKHRWKGGQHATKQNTLWAGKTMVTGHLHALQVRPHSDYNGTRWGVDTGTMAEPYGPQFVDYTEDSPKDWRSGFVVLTFHKGRLLWPELVSVMSEKEVSFRGRVIRV
jgi:hypothetical protein